MSRPPAPTIDTHKRNLLLMSFFRCYRLISSDKALEREGGHILSFSETASILAKHGKLGETGTAYLLLNQAPGKAGMEHNVTQFARMAVLPQDLFGAFGKPDELEALIKKNYPAAFQEFERWQAADPVEYFKQHMFSADPQNKQSELGFVTDASFVSAVEPNPQARKILAALCSKFLPGGRARA